MLHVQEEESERERNACGRTLAYVHTPHNRKLVSCSWGHNTVGKERVFSMSMLLASGGGDGACGDVCGGMLLLLRETLLVFGLNGFVALLLMYGWQEVGCMSEVCCYVPEI